MPTPTSFKDAQALNDIERNVRQYKDLDLFFTKKKLSSKDSDGGAWRKRTKQFSQVQEH